MQLTFVQILGLLILVMIIPTYQGYRNWHLHRSRKQLAMIRGWRYTNPWWQVVLKMTCSMAGTTPSGRVWHLRKVQLNRQILFIWSVSNSLLPYGRVVILPRKSLPGYRQREGLRLVSFGDEEWQSEYALLSTHDILGGRFFNDDIANMLLEWPAWPAPGALEDISWQSGRLDIRGRYQHDILALERIVGLGTALVENAVWQRKPSQGMSQDSRNLALV